MTTFDAKRALELADWCIAGPAVVLPYLPEVADMLRALLARLEAAENVCRSLEAWEGKPNSSLIRRWQYIRDAKEGT